VPVEFQRQGRVALITLNRPKTMNAISLELLDRIDEHLDAVAAEPEIGAVVITGSGKAFTAGADVGHMRGATPLEARAFAQRGHALTGRIEEFPKPVIAAVNGYALGGGCELALACDMRLAAESAQFGLPELKLGIMPGWGGTQRLARLTGPSYAKELIFTGRMVSGREAYERGLANQLHSDGALLDAAIGLADEISSRPPAALAAAKDLVNRALDGDRSGNLAREVDSFALAFTTEDAREGIEAFFEKRDPRFTGR
jgi:enoyl-CoA hydratase